MNEKIRFNILDIETYNNDKSEKLTPYCLCFKYKNRNYVYYGLNCIDNFLKWIFENCDNKSIFFAHNLTFDGALILNYLDDEIKIQNFISKNGSIFFFSLLKNNKIINFKCSFRILPLSLKNIATLFSLTPKLEINFYSINEKNILYENIKKEVIDYCIRDINITHVFLIKFNKIISFFLPNWRFITNSISGISLKIFKIHFNNAGISFSLSFNENKLLRTGYFGGRCEIFGNPQKDEYIFHYDFKSMHTHQLKKRFPVGKFIKKINPKNIDNVGFYLVTVESNLEVPILPYKDSATKKLIFPNGKFNGLYWHEELKLFEKNQGKILKIHWSLEFEKEDFLFKNFANQCLKLRQLDEINNIIWKLIPNSFIGRLGLKPLNERTLFVSNKDYNPIDYDVVHDKQINDNWLVSVKYNKEEQELFSNVIYPSIINSRGRILWWITSKKLLDAGGRLLYCDTDSFFIATKKNILNQKFGGIYWNENIKDVWIDKACFATSKVYCLKIKNKTTLKIKGVTEDKTFLSFEEFENLFFQSKKKKLNYKFFSKKNIKIKIRNMLKEINFANYDKRKFYDNFSKTKPLVINEDTLYNDDWDIKI